MDILKSHWVHPNAENDFDSSTLRVGGSDEHGHCLLIEEWGDPTESWAHGHSFPTREMAETFMALVLASDKPFNSKHWINL
jgi:hypothetical protein